MPIIIVRNQLKIHESQQNESLFEEHNVLSLMFFDLTKFENRENFNGANGGNGKRAFAIISVGGASP